MNGEDSKGRFAALLRDFNRTGKSELEGAPNLIHHEKSELHSEFSR